MSKLANAISPFWYKLVQCLLLILLYPLDSSSTIDPGLYIGHPYGITINPRAVIGKNCNIHRGVLIGQENRGKIKGVPTIGNNVWIGINAVVVGNITIGDGVMIAPNSFVNCDIPSHSIVFGNPCIINIGRMLLSCILTI